MRGANKFTKSMKEDFFIKGLFHKPEVSIIHITIDDLESLLNIGLLIATFTIAFSIS
jgi:hypothetical protein